MLFSVPGFDKTYEKAAGSCSKQENALNRKGDFVHQSLILLDYKALMGIIFIPGQFTHAMTFLRWARHYFGLYQMGETGNKTIDQNRWRNISLAVILSMIALETFLNEMAALALRKCPSTFDEDDRLMLMEKYRNEKKLIS